MSDPRIPDSAHEPLPASVPAEGELRAEIDRLRLENQHLVAEVERLSDSWALAREHVLRAWRGAWRRYYVARWHLLHVRDPKRGLRLRDEHAPYQVRVPRDAPPDRPRVLHVIGNLHTGGSAQLVVDLVERLGQRFDQHVLVRSLPPRPAYVGVDTIHRPRLTEASAARIVRRIGPDLVHVHMLGHQHDEYGRTDWRWYHAAIRAAERAGCPVVENLNIPVEPYVSPAVRCYVHVSDYVRQRFGRLDGWNTVIYPGSDLDVFARGPDQPVADDCLGMIYRLQPDKLNEQSIEPFVRAVQRRPATRVRIVGGGQLLDIYKRRVAEAGLLDAFTFTGYVPYAELPAELARMSVFVAPVHTESFGQVSVFAMGMGLPVAGYQVGALEEITGSADVLAPPGDADRLADVLVRLLDDRPRRLAVGRDNRQRAERLFSTEAMVARYQAVYDDLLASRPRVRSAPSWNHLQSPSAMLHANQAPMVTVLMAVYNGQRYLREAVQSILNQTFRNFELLVVDDASTDGSRAILESFDDPRLRVLHHAANRGLSRSLNDGLAQARGRYIARMDADDVSEADRLARQVDFLERHADVVAVGSWYTFIDGEGREVGRRWTPCDDVQVRWTLQFCSPFAHGAVTMRRDALAGEAEVYNESLRYAMDYDLWVRLAARGRLANLDRFLFCWRMAPGSMTSTLGDRTERLDRVTADIAAQLGWPERSGPDAERRADVICAMVAEQTLDISLEEATAAIDALFQLHERFCQRERIDARTAEHLRRELTRQTTRALYWLGHLYPDSRPWRFACRAAAAAVRRSPASLATSEAARLVVKLVGGRPLTAIARLVTQRSPAPGNPRSAGL
jgi:glycosyltransferase involved in cell wall biosynthesis